MLSPFSTAEMHREGRQKPCKCLTPLHGPGISLRSPASPPPWQSSLLPLTGLVALAELGNSQSGQGVGPAAVRLLYQGAAGSSSSRQVRISESKPHLPELAVREPTESCKNGDFFSLNTKCRGNVIMLFQATLLALGIRQRA